MKKKLNWINRQSWLRWQMREQGAYSSLSVDEMGVKIFGWHPEEQEKDSQADSQDSVMLKSWEVLFAGKLNPVTGMSHSKNTLKGNLWSKTVNPTFIKPLKWEKHLYTCSYPVWGRYSLFRIGSWGSKMLRDLPELFQSSSARSLEYIQAVNWSPVVVCGGLHSI